jgi:hypothetical protein
MTLVFKGKEPNRRVNLVQYTQWAYAMLKALMGYATSTNTFSICNGDNKRT